MALREYQRKRDFTKTPEPGPKAGRARKSNLSYLIQKHDATRLHYDFRLEMDGVLLSWAVTKGPSLDPGDKRLAVRTEDHPLSYGSFEGIIPKGQYGGGTVMLWDQGIWEPKGDPHVGLKKGHLSFSLKGKRLHGDWGLIRMHTPDKRENWLLIKENDDAAVTGKKAEKFLEQKDSSITTGRSMDEIAAQKSKTWSSKKSDKALDKLIEAYPEVQLATLVDHPPEGEDWVHEIKFDGYRLLGFVSGGAVRLRTRNGNDWTDKFSYIAQALSALDVKDAVLDMEAVVMDKNGKSNFQALKNSLGDSEEAQPIIACAFDILHHDGKSLTDKPLLERKAVLQKILGTAKDKSLLYSDHVEGKGEAMIARSCQMGLEGIISKRADAPYLPGRQKFWLKSKCNLRQEFVILGYSNPRKGNRAMGALYLGYYKGNRMQYAGKVGTGFTMQGAADIVKNLKKIATKKPAIGKDGMMNLGPGEYSKINWVKPEILCEVSFTEWTTDGHIRHPSFEGLRTDKEPIEVKEEKPIKVETAVKATKKNVIKRPKPKSGTLILDGITITHPDRVISETGHVTKGELAQYYATAAPYMLESMGGHPISLLRCPEGIGEGKECFYQRNPGRGLGADVKPFQFKHKDKNYEYLYVENTKGIVEMVQMGAIEIHPWGAKITNIDYPDRMIFDLDPDSSVPFEAVKLAAMDLRKRLKKHGLESNLKCTGGKGLHVTVPLAEKNTWEEVKSFAEKMADQMVADVPEAYIATMSKAKREGKIFIDFFRNDYTATAIADYAVRAREGAPVAMPLEWSELKKLKSPSQFTIKDAFKRLGKVKNKIRPQRLPK